MPQLVRGVYAKMDHDEKDAYDATRRELSKLERGLQELELDRQKFVKHDDIERMMIGQRRRIDEVYARLSSLIDVANERYAVRRW